MKTTKKEDLRVTKTRQAIHKVFTEMMLEMDYEQITVKELAERALINRKTFYLHYPTIDDLLAEYQEEMAEDFLRRTANYNSLRDMDSINREFFLASAERGSLQQKIACSGSYQAMNTQMIDKVMSRNVLKADGAAPVDEDARSIINAYLTASTMAMFRQWVADGQKMPLEKIIRLTSQLICSGTNGLADSFLRSFADTDS